MHRPTLVFALCTLALTACGESSPTAQQSALPAVKRVVLVSIDGLRADALPAMPTLGALTQRGAWTDDMQTVVPSITVPGHLSMLGGTDVTQLGIRSNAIDTTQAIALAMAGFSTVFNWVHGAGGTSQAVAGANLIPPALRESTHEFLGVDTMIATDVDGAVIMDRALAIEDGPTRPTLLFIHLPDADLAGHASGWIVPDAGPTDVLGSDYLAAVRRTDYALARLWADLSPKVERGEVALIVTADHGGGHGEGCTAGVPAYREHCTDTPGDRTIPFVLVAKGVTPQRLSSATRVTQVAPTIAGMLRIWTPRQADRPIGL
jgi:predicted AlkP superfamily pyrophosphatase or phosphodiesterase